MFVDIDNPKAPLGVEVMLFPYKKGKENITPEVCLDVLKSTNYQRSIKDMLNLILELPVEEQASFKDVVLSTFDNREQPNDIIVLGKKLAVSGGYEREMAFMAGRIRVGEWLPSHAAAEKWTICTEETLKNPKGNVFFLSKEVDLSRCDLSEVRGLKFTDEAEVTMWSVRNLSANLDVSKCQYISLYNCDLTSVKGLKFGDGAKVSLEQAENIPHDLDVSMCSWVNLSHCDLKGINELKFREGSDINLWGARNLPSDLDVSMCSKIDLYGCNLNKIQKIVFKNKQQMKDSHVSEPDDWERKVVFVDEANDGRGLDALHYMNRGGRE